MSIERRDILPEVLQVIKDKLEVTGEIVESRAKKEVPIDTGFLKGTIHHQVGDETSVVGDKNPWFGAKNYDPALAKDDSGNDDSLFVVVGANAEYAPYVEGKYKPFLQIALKSSLSRIKRLFER